MSNAHRAVTAKQRHKKVLKMAKGFRGRAKNNYRIALERVEKAMRYRYRDRRTVKREFRSLWIQRINAGCRELGIKYSVLIHGLKLANITMDRKILADMAYSQPEAFKAIVEQATAALAAS